jgi:Flp pilus assembly protein TadD
MALTFFAAAIKVDPQVRYLRRAATAALASSKLREAEEYAKKAADLDAGDASTVRTLARVFTAQGKLHEAEEALVHARNLKNENDVLAREIAADLAEVRRLMGPADTGGS